MPDETPSLHIDTDWKKQAQEEKRKLAEQEKQKQEPRVPEPRTPNPEPRTREAPPASFTTLVQSLMTQALYYLGDLTPRGTEPQVHLDMARQQIDLLGILDEKTKGNLTDDEKRLLDSALYEVRMRYVSVSSQYIT